jgi:ATP-binding cassette subfamily C protein CydCD
LKFDRRLLSLLKSHNLLLTLAISAGLLGGLLVVFQARILSSILNSIYLLQNTSPDVKKLLIILILLIILRGGTIWAGESGASRLAERIKTSLREQLYNHLIELGPGYFKQAPHSGGVRTGELIHVLNEGVEALDAYFSQYLPQLALAVLVPLTVLVFILPVDTLSGLVLLITAPLIPLFMILIGDRANTLTKRQWTTLSQMSAHFLDVLQGLTTLKIFGRSKDQVRVIAQIGQRYRHTTMGVLRVTFLSALVLEWVAMLSTAVVAVEIGIRLLYGRLTFEQAFFVLLLTPEFYLPLRLLGTRFHAGMAGVTAAGRIFEILEMPPNHQDSKILSSPSDLHQEKTHPRSVSIEIRNVQFNYSSSDKVLTEVSFDIPAGKMTALVGPSGAGKSTIADLLLRFIDLQGGEIFINKQPIKTIPISDYLAQVSWVSQDPYLFNTSVVDNIRLGRSDASLEEVRSSAKNAYAHEFINQLPQGYDTQIGERGARLSAGQAQRLALARAFLKDAPFLILDEATANLDPETSTKIQDALKTLVAGRTALVIAHRLNTIQEADQIILLDHGQVVESGIHSQLIDQRGFYWRMISGENAARPAPPPQPREVAPRQSIEPPLPTIPAVERTLSFCSLFSLLRLLAPYKWLVVLSVLLGWATVISGIGLLATSAYLISAAALQPSIAVLQVPIVGVRFFGLSRGIFRYLERYVSHDTTFRLIARLRVWFYQILEPLAPARLMQYQAGDLLNRIHHDINSLEDFYVRVVAPPLVWLLVSVTASALLAIFSIQLGLILLAFQIMAGLITPILVRSASQSTEHRLVQKRAELSAALVDGIQGMADLRVFNASGIQLGKVDEINRSMSGAQLKLGNLSGIESAAENVLAHLASWSILIIAIPLITTGQIGGVYLGTLILASLASFEAALLLPQTARSLERGLAATNRLHEIVATKPAVSDPKIPLPIPEVNQIEIEDLRFAYPTTIQSPQKTNVIDGISLNLPPGKRMAIVGPSGAGKTTLANILLRFWEYDEGQINLGDHKLNSYNQDELRTLIGVVFQRTHLFNATLRENFLLAKPDASMDEIRQACQLAQIDDHIESLPQKYDTWIGEGGMRLSGGERQRVAIARALLKNAPFLILDEPNANLDPLTERDLQNALFSLTEKRSTLWISHCLTGMDAMDEILVMDQGKIVERGQHNGLLELGGMYRRMWDLHHQIL